MSPPQLQVALHQCIERYQDWREQQQRELGPAARSYTQTKLQGEVLDYLADVARKVYRWACRSSSNWRQKETGLDCQPAMLHV